jgi:hypothetical protein
LTWTSKHADTAAIDPGIGSVAAGGSKKVSPRETTTYTISVTGPGGIATAQVTVLVNQAPLQLPTSTLTADPVSIKPGESSQLTWSSTHADRVKIEPLVGPVDENGSLVVTPTESTTYTISVSGSYGSAAAEVTMHVTGNP